jgi:hypothetical protein
MAPNENAAQMALMPTPTSRTRKQPRWHLVTNQLNLLYMLAAGMVMSPKGFAKKYYVDPLASFPGWVPLFADKVPRAALDLSASEGAHLVPSIATMELKGMQGPVMAIDAHGAARQLRFPEELTGTEAVLLVPAPLPLTWIESIAFRSKEQRVGCEADARDFGNVPLMDFKRKTAAKMFSGATDGAWPPAGLELSDRDNPADRASAAGGMMALLLHVSNLGDIGTQASRLGFDPMVTDPSIVGEPMIRELGAWMQTGSVSASADVLAKLFWGAVDTVANCRSAIDFPDPIDALLDYLEKAGEGLDERLRQSLSRLAGDLRELAGFADSTVTELFQRYPKPFSRVMTLFFLREKSADLIAFRHPLLSEADYVAAAILFAARDGWLGLPLNLRNGDGLHAAVSHRMAALDHRLSGSGLEFGQAPQRPLPLRELLTPGDKGWSAKQRDAAALLAREAKGLACVRTRINLGKGDYHMVVDTKGVQILLTGEAPPVETEVDPKVFFERLGRADISAATERKVRTLLEG